MMPQSGGDPMIGGRPLPSAYPRDYLPLLLTFRLTVVDSESGPLLPIMVRLNVPVGVCLVVETVKTEFPPPVIEVGLKVPVAFAGKPLTLKVTAPLNPFTGVATAVYVVLDPFFTVCAAGDGYIVKVDIDSVTVVLRVMLPLVPVIVMA
jgi:hypothetical protein